MSHHINRCVCGVVISRCRCPGPHEERIVEPCRHVAPVPEPPPMLCKICTENQVPRPLASVFKRWTYSDSRGVCDECATDLRRLTAAGGNMTIALKLAARIEALEKLLRADGRLP